MRLTSLAPAHGPLLGGTLVTMAADGLDGGTGYSCNLTLMAGGGADVTTLLVSDLHPDEPTTM